MYTTSLTSNSINTLGALQDTAIWGGIAAILAIIGGVLVYFLFVKAKTNPKGKFLTYLKKFLDFKVMWIETAIKILYYICTIYAVLFSFSLIQFSFLSFLFTLVVVPVLIRLAYEGATMLVMIWRNTADIAANTKK